MDIEQAFDRVWHLGLLYKAKKIFPAPVYCLLRSYLEDRTFFVNIAEKNSSIRPIAAGVPQGSVLGPMLYTIYTADMTFPPNTTIATFADDTALLAVHDSAAIASNILQEGLDNINSWFKLWNIKVNPIKSVHVTFSLRREECPTVYIDNNLIPSAQSVKYLGMHLDKRLTWKNHITAKKQQFNIRCKKMYWLLGRKSELSLSNKVLLYKAILKPIWTYGIQLWSVASKSHIAVIQRLQSKVLRQITNAPWYVSNLTIHKDLGIPFVSEEIVNYENRYSKKLGEHQNTLARNLLDTSEDTRRLKRRHVLEVSTNQPLRL